LIVGLKPGVLLSISFTKEWKRDTVIPALPFAKRGPSSGGDASKLVSGIYIYQLIAEKYLSSKKMVLLR